LSIIGIDASRALSTAPTGTEAYSWHLIQALVPLLCAKGYQVRLYLRGDGSELWQESQGRWSQSQVTLRTLHFPRLWTHVRLSWEMVQAPPDLLFVPAHVLPLLRPRRTLVTVHDLGYRVFPQAHPRLQRWYLELSTRWNVSVASHVLVDSRATRDAVMAAYGISSEKITIVYPGYASDLAPIRDSQQRAGVRQRYGIPGPYILFLGRIQPRKNLVRLIDAFAQIAPTYPQLVLVLAGPQGWLTRPIVDRVQAHGLTRRVLFPGYVATEDKAALISGAEVFAYPSLYEGFGFPVLEAQACGVPLLTSATSSLPEVAGDGALLVDPTDTEAIAAGLCRLLEDPALREALVARGFANLRRFSWERAARQVQEIIACLAGVGDAL